MNWKSILVSALITGTVTVAAGLILFWMQSKEPRLVYNSILSEPFVEENYSRYIQQIDIVNSGDTFLENINFSITFSNARITNHGVKIEPTIPYSEEVDETFLKINVDNLNENESVRISLILIATESELIEPKISLRASNAKGQIKEKGEKSEAFLIAIALASAYIGLFAALLSSRTGRKAFQRVARILFLRDFSGEQVHVIASALAISGLSNKAKEVLYPPHSRQYWSEADLLASEAISSGDEETRTKTLAALRIMAANDDMAPSSRAIVMCNIARILEVSGNTNEAIDALRSGREFSKRTLNERLKADPILQKFINALDIVADTER